MIFFFRFSTSVVFIEEEKNSGGGVTIRFLEGGGGVPCFFVINGARIWKSRRGEKGGGSVF